MLRSTGRLLPKWRRRLLANMDRYKDDSEYVTDIRKRAAER